MENTEKTTIHYYEHSEENKGDGSHPFDGQETYNLQGQHEVKEIGVPESAYVSIVAQPYRQEDKLSAVDLRMTRAPSSMINPTGIFLNIEHYKHTKNPISMTRLFKSVNSNNLDLVKISSDSREESPIENANYTISNLESCKDDFNQVSHNQYTTTYQKIDYQKKCSIDTISFNEPVVWNAKPIVDYALLVDQETQTQVIESNEVSVQTKKYTNKCTSSLLKRENISNYSCLICQRFYTSKSSYDRHAQTHLQNGNVVKNIHLTKKEKFMIFGENICKSRSNGLPMTSQKPKLPKFQCGICCKLFSSQVARDLHRDNFVQEVFSMTKCRECHVPFFTLGALNEHVNFVHKRNTNKCSAYCCIFCSESFESSFSFQLHLDEHLCT